MKYTVGITGRIYVFTEIEVEAETEKEAEGLALSMAYAAEPSDWSHYTDIPDSETLQVEDISEN